MSDQVLKCPRCQGILCTIEYDGVLIETCPDCQGEWLHAGELEKIVEHHEEVFTAAEVDAIDAVNKSMFTIEACESDRLLCPVCAAVELEHFHYCNTSGVILHKCPACTGIWTDKDQLEEVEILVDEWKARLNEDSARFGPALDKIEAYEQKQLDKAVSISRSGFANAILRRFCE